MQNLDLTKHRLIYEGSLNWRIGNRQKLIDLHVLLLEDVIILLQKQDEKYILKFYNTNTTGGGSSGNSDRSPTLSPIIKVSTVLVRPNAVGKSLFLTIRNVLTRRREYGTYLATARRHRRRIKMQKRDE